jgi:hypothetical protein
LALIAPKRRHDRHSATTLSLMIEATASQKALQGCEANFRLARRGRAFAALPAGCGSSQLDPNVPAR